MSFIKLKAEDGRAAEAITHISPYPRRCGLFFWGKDYQPKKGRDVLRGIYQLPKQLTALTCAVVFYLLLVLPIFGQNPGKSNHGQSTSSANRTEVIRGKSNAKKSIIFEKDRIIAKKETLELNGKEGVFIWLDESGTWQMQWIGPPGTMIWIRVIADNSISAITTVGDMTDSSLKGDVILTVTGVASGDTQGISFISESVTIDVDAKWNFKRDVSKVFISEKKLNPEGIPFGIKAVGTGWNAGRNRKLAKPEKGRPSEAESKAGMSPMP